MKPFLAVLWILSCFCVYMVYMIGWAGFVASVIPWLLFMVAMWIPLVYLTIRR